MIETTVYHLSDGWHVTWRDQKIAQVFANEAAAQAFVELCNSKWADIEAKALDKKRAANVAAGHHPDFQPLTVISVPKQSTRQQVSYVCPACGGGLISVQTRRGGWVVGFGPLGCIGGLLASLFMNRTRTQWRCSRCGLICSVTPKSTKQEEWAMRVLLMLLMLFVIAFGLWLRSCSLIHPSASP